MVPSERQLCEHYGVSPITARRALLELARDGLVYRQQGIGTFVAGPARGQRLTLVFAGFDPARWSSAAGGMGDLVGGVSEVAWRHNCALHLVRTDGPLEASFLSGLLRDGGSDGLLLRIAGNVMDDQIETLERTAFPYVVIRRYLAERPMNCVVPADDVGVRLAVDHLAKLGHRRIGFISALPDMILTQDRLRGYAAAVIAHGLEHDQQLVRVADDFGSSSGYRAAVQLLSLPARPSAVIVDADADMVSGLYQAAADLGLESPRDLAVVGYDAQPEVRALVPGLTCIRTSHYDTGRSAAELLLDLILGHARGPRRLVIEPVLEVRASCGARLAQTNDSIGVI